MLALKLTDHKDFMSKLLVHSVFDSFYIVEASINTYQTYTIDGTLQRSFYEEAQLPELFREEQKYARWKESRNLCLAMIRGSRSPLRFRFVFQQSLENTEKVHRISGSPLALSDIHGLYLNFQYNGETITCTTGTSVGVFTMDRSLERTWDSLILSFFRQQNIKYEQES